MVSFLLSVFIVSLLSLFILPLLSYPGLLLIPLSSVCQHPVKIRKTSRPPCIRLKFFKQLKKISRSTGPESLRDDLAGHQEEEIGLCCLNLIVLVFLLPPPLLLLLHFFSLETVLEPLKIQCYADVVNLLLWSNTEQLLTDWLH